MEWARDVQGDITHITICNRRVIPLGPYILPKEPTPSIPISLLALETKWRGKHHNENPDTIATAAPQDNYSTYSN